MEEQQNDNTNTDTCEVELSEDNLKRFITTSGHAIIEAVAGAGKSYQMIQALRVMPPDSRILFMAFNSSNVKDFEKDVLPKIKALRSDLKVEAFLCTALL